MEGGREGERGVTGWREEGGRERGDWMEGVEREREG